MGQQLLGTTIIIENRAGGGGSIGTAAVAKSPPDGSTWVMVFDNHAANPFVMPNMPFDTEKDLDPVQLIALCAVLFDPRPAPMIERCERDNRHRDHTVPSDRCRRVGCRTGGHRDGSIRWFAHQQRRATAFCAE